MLADAPAVAHEVSRAWNRLVVTEGRLAVDELAREVGWSRRHLTQRFHGELGLTPKAAGRVLRFERAVRLLRRSAPPGLAEIAHACGYYDQAHMNREWRALAGRSPTGWLAEELPNIQDGTSVPRQA
ncbi:helix-turn-helix domain-containing protein [Allosalinactinospora lopnorensis]|uniref:helix-turn-helix domain-containing protein n=1 Tax=Allosalinactinospora lopnorensis TaxID=1352348 RepID=UPI000A72A07D|nr:helix-turn-helix domain-containing protein [Allosalinactinospora lopnorensis]